jgi:hypothetical protein
MNKRTTIRLPPEVMTRAKRKAAAEGRTLASLIEDGVMRVLEDVRKPARPAKRLRLPVSKATGGLLQGIDLTRFSDYQETEDRDYAERLSKGFK